MFQHLETLFLPITVDEYLMRRLVPSSSCYVSSMFIFIFVHNDTQLVSEGRFPRFLFELQPANLHMTDKLDRLRIWVAYRVRGWGGDRMEWKGTELAYPGLLFYNRQEIWLRRKLNVDKKNKVTPAGVIRCIDAPRPSYIFDVHTPLCRE